ncbi:MAG: type 4a pilus biogenesis protein PilO [Candidatus Berkelbacteria bacterium]
MPKFNNERFQAVCAVFIAIAAIVVCWQYALPSYNKNVSDQAKYKADVAAADIKLASVKKNEKVFNDSQTSATINLLNIAIPEDKDLPNLITELEAIATNHGMFIPAPSITDGTDNTVMISFGISGTLQELTDFMTTIQKDLRFFNIKSVSMSTSKDIVNMSLSIEAYKRASSAVAK